MSAPIVFIAVFVLLVWSLIRTIAYLFPIVERMTNERVSLVVGAFATYQLLQWWIA